ncbi:biopolymer transport protein ExbD [Alkalispirochaeta americana]|uniref:Biopolymer transport protein ExbD n=1 Tax=Alkalispirochaeta americana TaxID=159291 RepID=A0A1N6W1U0_9SPIO|nr:biopolymer transporter ExbD [Alkalispirochaeta americana]SIQ83876.1 biopolymer transport protein ExbD [Alkalispirochaeta americana]
MVHFQRRLQPKVQVDLVPMIDVVFQLVIFFMLSSTLITRTGLDLDLPGARSSQETVSSSVVLSVVSREEIYLGEDRMTLAELEVLLGEKKDEFQDRAISIEADASLPYGTMISVLDVLRLNGFRGANLVAEQIRERHGTD